MYLRRKKKVIKVHKSGQRRSELTSAKVVLTTEDVAATETVGVPSASTVK